MDWSFYCRPEQGNRENSEDLHMEGDRKEAKTSSSIDWISYTSIEQGENCEKICMQMDGMDEVRDGNIDKHEEKEGICGLGSDQILAILECLPIRSVIAFGMTCRRFRGIADSDAMWSLICRREWGSKTVDSWPCLGVNTGLGWKELYRKMLVLGSITWRRLHQGDILPSARASHSMATLSNNFLIFGGGQDGGEFGIFYAVLFSLFTFLLNH